MNENAPKTLRKILEKIHTIECHEFKTIQSATEKTFQECDLSRCLIAVEQKKIAYETFTAHYMECGIDDKRLMDTGELFYRNVFVPHHDLMAKLEGLKPRVHKKTQTEKTEDK
jgi:hypothetical protein